MAENPTDNRKVLLALLALGAREIREDNWCDADELFAELGRTESSAEGFDSSASALEQESERDETSFAGRRRAAKIWVRPGWMPLVLQARQKLIALDVELLEAREKLGTLRLHVAAIHTRRPDVRDIIETAATLAAETCDICGAWGRRYGGVALRVRCPQHAAVADLGV